MLTLFGKLYAMIANVRNALYDKGVFKSYALCAKTISVGNITTGGTGKTPLVAYIAETLADRGEKVCILTRGYGRKNPKKRVLVSNSKEILSDAVEAGDEPLELAMRLVGKAIVLADADRVAAGMWAKKEFGVTAFVLDDGFQHRRVKRDLDIICIDATNPFANGKVLPAGRLREPLSNLNRADAIVITRANLAKDLADLQERIAAINPTAAIFQCRTQLEQIVPIKDFLRNGAGSDNSPIPKDEKAFAFCGLGNPADFLNMLSEKFELCGSLTFQDHHYYSIEDIRTIERQARAAGASVLITTGKDAVKLKDAKFELNCFAACIGIRLDDEMGFRLLL
jgi:tetraacyldisaccharide 4''-kinase